MLPARLCVLMCCRLLTWCMCAGLVGQGHVHAFKSPTDELHACQLWQLVCQWLSSLTSTVFA